MFVNGVAEHCSLIQSIACNPKRRPSFNSSGVDTSHMIREVSYHIPLENLSICKLCEWSNTYTDQRKLDKKKADTIRVVKKQIC